jgi:hypothetical protein
MPLGYTIIHSQTLINLYTQSIEIVVESSLIMQNGVELNLANRPTYVVTHELTTTCCLCCRVYSSMESRAPLSLKKWYTIFYCMGMRRIYKPSNLENVEDNAKFFLLVPLSNASTPSSQTFHVHMPPNSDSTIYHPTGD